MSDNDYIEAEGEVIEAMRGAIFKVKLTDGKILKCSISGKIRKNNITILPGDSVTIAIPKYDITKGRIVYRHKKKGKRK